MPSLIRRAAIFGVLLICIIVTLATAGPTQWSPVGAQLVRIAAPTATDLHAARFGTRAWRVAFDRDRLLIAPAQEIKPAVPFPPAIETAHLGYRGSQPTQALRAGSDWLLAYDFGEFGGGLWQFDSKGIVGRRLLDEPTFGLLRYGNEVLAETQDNPMSVRRLRIHRFAQIGGKWQEVGHVDFSRNIVTVAPIGSSIYAMVDDYPAADLAKIDLAGHLTVLWRYDRDLRVSDIARSSAGDFALGSTGYVVHLHRANGALAATWYAPRDCVTYSNVSEADGAQAHCVGSGVPGYQRRSLVPVRSPLLSSSGHWLLSRYSPLQLLHFTGSEWLAVALPPFSNYEYPYQINEAGSNLILRTSQHVWLRENGYWRSLGAAPGCPSVLQIAMKSVWAVECSDAPKVSRIGFDGAHNSWQPVHGVPELLAPGNFDDAWFSEKDVSFLGHVDASGHLTETSKASPIISLSRGGDKVWFTEADKMHYGFVDAQNQLHEFKEPSQYVEVLGVTGTPHAAWMRDSLAGRMMLYHMEGPSHFSNYIADIRFAVVSPDGSAWAVSSMWPTVVHVTEDGKMTRYRLPCLDAHVQLSPAPGNGVWVQSLEPLCNALIDSTGMHVRDLPLVERVDYL